MVGIGNYKLLELEKGMEEMFGPNVRTCLFEI